MTFFWHEKSVFQFHAYFSYKLSTLRESLSMNLSKKIGFSIFFRLSNLMSHLIWDWVLSIILINNQQSIFVHISNILDITGQILTFCGPKSIWPHFFVYRNHFGPSFFWPKYFIDPSFFWIKNVMGSTLFGPKIFLPQIYIAPNFFQPKTFQPHIFFGPNFLLTPNFFCT